jgi:hypothetical protein
MEHRIDPHSGLRLRRLAAALVATLAAALLIANAGAAAAAPSRAMQTTGYSTPAGPLTREEEVEEEVEWEWGEEEEEEEAAAGTEEIEVEIEFEEGEEARASGTESWPAGRRRSCRHRGKGRHSGRVHRACRRTAVATSSRV